MSQSTTQAPVDGQGANAGGVAWRTPIEVICFGLVASLYALHLFIAGDDTFHYDSSVYWKLGESFASGGHFSFFSYQDVTAYSRGYSWPLICHWLDVIGSKTGMTDVTVVRLFGALLASTLGVIVAPRLARRLFSEAAVTPLRVLALNGLFFLYWRDHFGFPLSDFPALVACAVGVLMLVRASPWGYVLAGTFLGIALNMRAQYVPALAAGLIVAAWIAFSSRDLRHRAAAVLLLVGGFFVVSTPQILINHHSHSSVSPTVPAGDLAMLQLTDGMLSQKYETYVGPASGYRTATVFFLDPSTTHVLDKEGEAEITSYGQYLGIVIRNPAELAASYVRHVFNGLDVRYPTPYVRSLDNSPILLSLVLYAALFTAIARLLLSNARRALGRIHWLGISVLLSPLLTAIPSTVETRFFLPAQLLVYMLVCFGPDYRGTLFAGGTTRRAAIAAACVAFALVCLTFSSATLSQIQYPGPTLGAGFNRPLLDAD
jgi:hypothetical protein